jgi:hypothetical protein
MAADFVGSHRDGLEHALNNGLDEAENRELIVASEPTVIADLVLTGLSRRLR